MARRTETWTATYGRDAGKQFILTEMSAVIAERWAVRVALALLNANVPVPDGAMQAGMAGVASILEQGVRGLQGLQAAVAQPLLDELLSCAKLVAPGNAPPVPLWTDPENCQVEEVRTLWELRMKVLEMHLGFSVAALVSSTREKTATPPAQA